MRPSHVSAFLLGLIFLRPVSRVPGQDRKPVAPPAPTIEELVGDLGHPVYATREAAHRELWKRGDAAIPALEKALTDENPEVARRARELLDKFAWGLRPDTPPAVIKVLRRFQAGDENPQKSAEIRKEAILELLRLGQPGVSVARALLGKELPDDTRIQVVAQLTALVRREVPLRLFEGKADEAAELMAVHAAGTGPEGAADYAAFQLLRGELPAATASAELALKGGKHPAAHRLTLAHLYRAGGQWEKARAVAGDLPRAAGGSSLVELLREEEGDWATLADTLAFAGMNHPDAARLTLLRLAGRKD